MTTNLELEKAIKDRYPNSGVTRIIGSPVLKGFEEIGDDSFTVYAHAGDRDYSLLLHFFILPVVIPIDIYRSHRYSKGLEIKKAEVLGHEFEKEYFKIGAFAKYLKEEAQSRGIGIISAFDDGANFSFYDCYYRPIKRIIDTGHGLEKQVLEGIESVLDFQRCIDEKYSAKEDEIMRILKS